MSTLMTELVDAGQHGMARELERAHDIAEQSALSPADRFGLTPEFDKACVYLSTMRRRAYVVLNASTAQEVGQ